MKEVKDPEILKLFKEENSINEPNSFLEKSGKYAEKFNKFVESSRLPSAAGGFLQGAGDMASSIANIPLGLAGSPKIPHPELQKYLPQDTLSKAAFLGGEIGASIPGWMGTEGIISKFLPETTGFKRIGQKAITGALTGAAVGEESPGGRLANAAIGTIIPPSLGISSKNIAGNIIKQKNKVSKEYNKMYEDIFSTAKKEGLNDIKLPSVNYDLIKDNMPSKQFRSIKVLQKNPTVENAHRAQSDLGKFINSNRNKVNDSETNKAIKEAIIAQKKLKGKIHTKFYEKPELGLSEQYSNATKGYEKDVVPYKYNKDINKYLSQKLKDSSLIKKLISNDEFMIKQGKKYPEMKLHALMKSPWTKAALGGGAAAIGFPQAYDYISSNY